jgi:hypothetical protein
VNHSANVPVGDSINFLPFNSELPQAHYLSGVGNTIDVSCLFLYESFSGWHNLDFITVLPF